MKLEYSQEFADKFGYAKAKLANGSEIKFTNHVTDSSEAQNLSGSLWKDKEIVFQGKDKDLVSIDKSNLRNHKNFHDYNQNPRILNDMNFQNELQLQLGIPTLMIVGNILDIRKPQLKNSKDLPNKKLK